MLGPGFAGVEPIFALLILEGYAFGATLGASLGAMSLVTSALLLGGVGPWLPFQALGAALVGAGVGVLPRFRSGALRMITLSVWGIVSSYAYGAIVTVWQWPLLTGSSSSLSYLPSGTIEENAIRFLQYSLVSGGLLWDTGRAITTVIILLIASKTILAALERAANRLNLQKSVRKSER
jgi:hypothetical protein